ncbi:MAG: histidinol dehydrogenase [Chloroflexota bacterium]
MLKIYNRTQAEQTILKRAPLDLMAVPESILERNEKVFGERISPAEAVRRILEDVRRHGDEALHRWNECLDGVTSADLRISCEAAQQAWKRLPADLQQALQKSAQRIEAFHRRQPVTSWITQQGGGTLGQLVRPLHSVGLYIPGGSAPLPSTVLMSAIPARVAGVERVVMVTPAERGGQGVADVILAAAALAGVDEIYTLGGAQAIAALAYGSESMAKVDKIFGPGNLFVTLAKQQVYGVVGIDGLAGPTETMVIADEDANPAWVAADLLAQAEHDVLASAILLTPSRRLAEAVQVEVVRQMEGQHGESALPRAEIIAQALTGRSGIVLTADIAEAVDLANAFAPEHLALSVKDPWRWVEKVTNAGGVFLGEGSFEVLGDYVAGPSHVMPTGGSARFASPLSVLDFVRFISLVALNDEATNQLCGLAAQLARSEGLEAHARAALQRSQGYG